MIEINNEDITPGLIDNDTGAVNVSVFYSAILFRPFLNEVMDAIVTTATEVNIHILYYLN